MSEKLKIVVYKDKEYYDEAEINWEIYEKICDLSWERQQKRGKDNYIIE